MSEAVIRTSPPAGPSASFFGRHWRGEYSLGRSYWLHTVLLSSLVPALAISVLARLTNDMPARYGMAGVLGIAAFSYLAWTWDNWSGGCSSGPTLITDYTGTPTNFGAAYKAHITTLP